MLKYLGRVLLTGRKANFHWESIWSIFRVVSTLCHLTYIPFKVYAIFLSRQKEFMDCVLHIRLLSWLLVGALMHSCYHNKNTSIPVCMPVPPDASCHIADHIQVRRPGLSCKRSRVCLNTACYYTVYIFGNVLYSNMQLWRGPRLKQRKDYSKYNLASFVERKVNGSAR